MSDAPTSSSRSTSRLLGKVALALLMFAVTIELLVRVVVPQPRVQIVRPSQDLEIYEIDGQVLWHEPEPEPRWNEGCRTSHPNARNVLIFGSSIFFGTRLEADQVWSHHLQRSLDERLGAGQVCVHNYAQPGYAAENNLAVARELLRDLKTPVILWQIWGSDRTEYRRIGGSIYAVDRIRCDDEGYPVGFGLPAGIHHGLFRASRAYEYAVLSLVPEAEDARGEFAYRDRVVPKLDALLQVTSRAHATLKLFMAPVLDKPFRDQIGDRALYGSKLGSEKAAAEWADAHGVPRTELAELLVEEDYLAIRMDPCCHYNADGHLALARVMLPQVLELLDASIGE